MRSTIAVEPVSGEIEMLFMAILTVTVINRTIITIKIIVTTIKIVVTNYKDYCD